MAVIVFDTNNDTVTVLVEGTDSIHVIEDNTTNISGGRNYAAGKVFINGSTELCMVRGERE